jgi:phosphinothricin acetyltransferase
MLIRDAVKEDLPALLAIYNDVIATSTAVYVDQPTTLDERRAWWQGRVAAGYPVLVAEDESGVIGFAPFGDFRPRPGYRFTVEHSVYVRADCRGRGTPGGPDGATAACRCPGQARDRRLVRR